MRIDGSDLRLGDGFADYGKTWTVCGWVSAVGHIAAEARDGERRVFSRHGTFDVVSIGSDEVSHEWQ